MYLVYIPELNISIRKHVDHLLRYKGGEAEDDGLTYYDCEASVPEPPPEPEVVEEVDIGEVAQRFTEAPLGPDDICSGPDDTPFMDCESVNRFTEPGNLVPQVRSSRNANPMYKF